jgi:Protein of unknown function (DUF5672)
VSLAARRKRVVILVLVHKPDMNQNEALSLQQCISILDGRDLVVVCPSEMDVSSYRRISERIDFYHIDPWWQSTYRSFNRLKISPLLYWKFRRYDYILFYELDAFVFRDELDHWCEAGYDYIGAPWFQGFDNCSYDSPFLGVGNGGFSLRRTSSALRVLRSFSYIRKPRELYWEQQKLRFDNSLAIIRNLTLRNNTFYPLNDFSGNEDLFWGLIASRNFPFFKVAPIEEARKFSIECNPRKLFELNGNQLPFGCHAWQKYDPEFWVPHITANATSMRVEVDLESLQQM